MADERPSEDWLQGLLRGVPRQLVAAAAVTLVVVPALATLLFIGLYGVNGPEWDHLNSAEIFERWEKGILTLDFLFRPHNEHRKPVPRLVVLAFGHLTRFNNRAEMVLQWGLLCATIAILFRAFCRDTKLLGSPARALLLFLPIAWLMVSIRPYEIMLVGDGLLTYLSLIFFVSALYVLAFVRSGWSTLALAVLLGLLTTFSQSNGLLVWPVGFLLLACDVRVRPGREALVRAAVWAVCGAATIGGYFHNYQDPANHPSPGFVFQHRYDALAHFLAVGGGSLSPEMRSAVSMGILVAGLECLVGLAVLRDWWRDRERPPFGAWLVVCALTTQVMISLNRAGFGMGQGLSPRYATYSGLAPIGLFWCAVARRDRWRLAQPAAVALATMMTVGFFAGTLDGWTHGREWFSERGLQAYLLYSAKFQPRSALTRLYPNPDHARLYAEVLERLKLNVFADPHVDAAALAAMTTPPPYTVDLVNGAPAKPGAMLAVSDDDAVMVAGWALDPNHRDPAATVFLTVDGTTDYPGHVGIERPDIARAYGSRPARWSGFAASISARLLPPGNHVLTIKIVSADRAHVFVTDPVATVVRNAP